MRLGSKRLAEKVKRTNISSTKLQDPESRKKNQDLEKKRSRMKMYKPVKIHRMSEKQKDGESSKGFVGVFLKAMKKFCRETKD